MPSSPSVEPSRLPDALGQHRGATGIEPDDPAGAFLGDEDAAPGVDREPDRSFEVSGDDATVAIGQAGDRTGLAVGDVDVIVVVNREAAQAGEAVSDDLERSERRERRGWRQDGAGGGDERECEDEYAMHALVRGKTHATPNSAIRRTRERRAAQRARHRAPRGGRRLRRIGLE